MITPLPPDQEDYRIGQKLMAGLTQSTVLPEIDFETYSEAGHIWDETLKKFVPPRGARDKGLQTVGMAVYSEHPSTEVICLAYNLKDGFGTRQWQPGDANPIDLFFHLQDGGLLEAWNVSFEYYIWNNVCVRRYGWPPLVADNLRCAASKSRAFALPGSLDACGKVLDIKNKKLADGKKLIKRYCEPRNPTKYLPEKRNSLRENIDDFRLMFQYNVMDIKAEAEISNQIPDLSFSELEFWLADQRINYRGVRLDRKMIECCIAIAEKAFQKYTSELITLTNGVVTSVSQVAKTQKWLEEYSVFTKSLDEEHVTELLKTDIHNPVRRVLEIRQLIGSAAVKKLFAMINRLSSDDRMRDLFVYHAARTGRAGGNGVQPQNLPNNNGVYSCQCTACGKYFGTKFIFCPWCGEHYTSKPHEWNPKAIQSALEIIATGRLNCLEYYFGEAISTISGCLRGMFISAEGHDFISSDYASIEGVVLASLAGEEWHLEVYRTHTMMYEMTASKISGIPLEEFIRVKQETGKHHELRKIGKVGALASGYGGWIGAWINFKANEFLSEEEMKKAILAWRAASPMIVKLWKELETCAHMATMYPNREFSYRHITYIRSGNILYCKLPSGRNITYHKPQLAPSERRPGTMELSFEGWNTDPKKGAIGWCRMTTYGGKLTENCCQAVARDILSHAIVNLEKQGFPVVLHVHDEIVCEVPEDVGSVAELEYIMMKLPEWAEGWPIKATGGWRAKRYQK